jgi:hypothetical protein
VYRAKNLKKPPRSKRAVEPQIDRWIDIFSRPNNLTKYLKRITFSEVSSGLEQAKA